MPTDILSQIAALVAVSANDVPSKETARKILQRYQETLNVLIAAASEISMSQTEHDSRNKASSSLLGT